MKAVSEIKQKALSEFLSKSEQSLANDDTNELIEQTRAYLSQVKKYHARVLKTVTVLDEPFDFSTRRPDQEALIRNGVIVTRAFASRSVSAWDKSCTDPTHLMYLPRHDEGAPHEIKIISGRALPIEEMPRLEPKKPTRSNQKSKRNSPQEKSRSTSARPSGLSTVNLMQFIARHGDDFEVSDFMRDCGYDDRGPATHGGRSFECPNEHNHTNPAEGLTRFFVRDASENNGHGFHIYCAGATCSAQFARDDEPQKQDRAKWLDYICQEKGIDDAISLRQYCPGADATVENSVLEEQSDLATKVREYNDRYAIAMYGSNVCVAVKPRKINEPYRFVTPQALAIFHKPERVGVAAGRDGVRQVEAFPMWMKDPARNTYANVIFEPYGINEHDTTPSDTLNLWCGLGVKPVPGDWSLLRRHIYENLCQGNAVYFAWLMSWLADLVKNPSRKPGTSVVVRGKKAPAKPKLLSGSEHYFRATPYRCRSANRC